MPTITAADLTGTAPVSPVDKQPDTLKSALQEAATPPVEKPVDDALSPKFAILARKEKAMREHARQLEAEKQALEGAKAEIEQAKSWKTRLLQDPLSVMQEAGLTYDQLTNFILNQPKPEDMQFLKLQQELASQKVTQEQILNQIQQTEAQHVEQAKKLLRREIDLLVDDGDSFEAIRTHGELAKDAVMELIQQTLNEDGYLMNTEEAAKEIEEHLIEQAISLSRLKAVQSKLNPTPPVEEEQVMEAPKPMQTQKPHFNTLSNRITPSTTQPVNDRERRQRAILAFQGKL